jgi:hypothetical protein
MKKIKINKLPEGFKRLPDGKIVKSMEKGGQPILNAAPRAAANLEAEKGETVVTDLDNNNIPEHYKIGGKKHSQGGTPLNLPAKSFIFSDHKSMSLKGEDLKKFTNTSKKSMTPAAIASLKKFDISEENEILKDENADKMAKATAERNIQSKLTKLGELAMVQEGMKDFEGGIPEIALPFLKRNGVSPEQVEMINAEIEQRDMMEDMMASYGKEMYGNGGQKRKYKYQTAGEFTSTYEDFESLMNTDEFSKLLDGAYKNYKAENPKSKATKQEMKNALMKMQKQNYTFRDKGLTIDEESWDRYNKVGRNAAYKDATKDLNLDALSEKDIKLAQSAALTLADFKYDPAFANNDIVQRMQFTATGEEGALSNVDGLYGDNTAKTLLSLAPAQEAPAEEPIQPGTPEFTQKETEPGGYYLEDAVNVASALMMRTPMEYGYTQRLQPNLADPVFLDPERTLQANQEVGAINAQAMALQGRGQNLGANLSLLQGKLAANQANALSQFANGNVQIANQFEGLNNQFLNKVSEFNAAQNRQQRIDTATVNESKASQDNQRRALLAKSINRFLSNPRQTAMLSDMYPNAAVNPLTEQGYFVAPTGDVLFDQDEIADFIRKQEIIAANQPRTKEQSKKSKGGQGYGSFNLSKFIKR